MEVITMKSKSIRISMLLLLVCVTATGCFSPRQDVPTLWDKLGIPQGYAVVRDHFTNKSGNRPWKEAKPPLLRIADAANLESPNDAIKAAAEIKMEEDLAAQKIKALKYLGKIGCGCYDESGKVEAALMAGLSDCTPAVRMAAIDAIKEALQNCNLGLERDKRQDRKYLHQQKHEKKVAKRKANKEARRERIQQAAAKRRAKCGMCGGHGCSSCIECTTCLDMGCDTCIENCDPCGGCDGGCSECMVDDCCTSCNACSCCTEKIQKKLADMAFGKQDNGCWKEPVAAIRAAAQAVMCLCPAPECEVQEENGGGDDNGGGGLELPPELKDGEGNQNNGEGENNDGNVDDTVAFSFNAPITSPESFGAPITQQTRSNPAPITSIDEFGQPQPTLSNAQAQTQSAAWQGSNAPVIESDIIENDPNMISATISSINQQAKSINVNYHKEFMLPKGAKIVVRDLAGNDIEMIVENSTPGSAEAKASSNGTSLPSTSSVQIGVVSL